MEKTLSLILLFAALLISSVINAYGAALVIPDRSTELKDMPAAVCTNQYLKGSGGVFVCADAAPDLSAYEMQTHEAFPVSGTLTKTTASTTDPTKPAYKYILHFAGQGSNTVAAEINSATFSYGDKIRIRETANGTSLLKLGSVPVFNMDSTEITSLNEVANLGQYYINGTSVEYYLHSLNYAYLELEMTNSGSWLTSTEAILPDQFRLFNTSGTNTGDQDLSGYALLASLGTAAAKDIPATGDASATEVVMGSDTRLSETCVNTSTTPYTVLAVDDSIYVDASGGARIVNLPAATGSGRILTIKKVDTTLNTVTVTADTEGTPDTIDSVVSFIIANPWTAITVQDAATNTWYVR